MLGGIVGLVGAILVGPRFRKRPDDLAIQRSGEGLEDVKEIQIILKKYPELEGIL